MAAKAAAPWRAERPAVCAATGFSADSLSLFVILHDGARVLIVFLYIYTYYIR